MSLTRKYRWYRHMYSAFGWPVVLPQTLAIYSIFLQNIKKEHGWGEVPGAIFHLTLNFREDAAPKFWKAVMTLVAILLLVGFIAWGFTMLLPTLLSVWAAAIDGISFRWPEWLFHWPAINRETLFTWPVFIRYGWMLLVVAWVVGTGWNGIKELITFCFVVAMSCIIFAWGYSVYEYWPKGATTDQFFSFGRWLPVVMPMETFQSDAGYFSLCVAVYAVFDHLRTSTIIEARKREAANKLGVGRGADSKLITTSDELTKGGLI
jgi:hypothetical protein